MGNKLKVKIRDVPKLSEESPCRGGGEMTNVKIDRVWLALLGFASISLGAIMIGKIIYENAHPLLVLLNFLYIVLGIYAIVIFLRSVKFQIKKEATK